MKATLSERRSNSEGAEEKWLLVVLMILGMFMCKVCVLDEREGGCVYVLLWGEK